MSKEILKNMIDAIDERDEETIFRVLARFVPESAPFPDEIQAIQYAKLHGEYTPADKIDLDI